MLQKRKFIFGDETLLAYCRSEKLGDYLFETPSIGTVFETEIEALAYYRDDSFIRFVRFDTKSFEAEDVTEQMAMVWIYAVDGGLGADEETSLPLFVAGCEAAMGALRQDWQEIASVAPYSTMNHRTQGLSGGARV